MRILKSPNPNAHSLTLKALTIALALAHSTGAGAQTVGNCVAADAPGGAGNCGGKCYLAAGGDYVCDLQSCGGASSITMVESYNASLKDFSAWGSCNATAFCCGLTDAGGAVTKFFVAGSNYDDTIDLMYTSYQMQPHAASDIVMYVRGFDGNDDITGSDYQSCPQGLLDYWGSITGYSADDYTEHLFGGDGDDNILAKEGCDYIYGNAGHDDLFGNFGHDCMYGGWGIDSFVGGRHGDYLEDDCQHNGAAKQHMEGGPSDDELWYIWDETCDSDDVLDATSTCDQGTPAGTGDSFGPVNSYQSLLADCEGTLTSQPENGCAPANIPSIPPPPD